MATMNFFCKTLEQDGKIFLIEPFQKLDMEQVLLSNKEYVWLTPEAYTYVGRDTTSTEATFVITNKYVPTVDKTITVIWDDNNDNNKKKPFKDFRFELNEILQKRSVSKSSRAQDLKGGFRYQAPMNSTNSNFSVKYTNKIIKS